MNHRPMVLALIVAGARSQREHCILHIVSAVRNCVKFPNFEPCLPSHSPLLTAIYCLQRSVGKLRPLSSGSWKPPPNTICSGYHGCNSCRDATGVSCSRLASTVCVCRNYFHFGVGHGRNLSHSCFLPTQTRHERKTIGCLR